jgi:hypothetical protein
MRTITILLTVLACQMSAAYIPSTVYVQRNPAKITAPDFAKSAQARDNYATDASPVVSSEAESQALSTAPAAALPAELYVLTPASKRTAQAPPMRNCCITGK